MDSQHTARRDVIHNTNLCENVRRVIGPVSVSQISIFASVVLLFAATFGDVVTVGHIRGASAEPVFIAVSTATFQLETPQTAYYTMTPLKIPSCCTYKTNQHTNKHGVQGLSRETLTYVFLELVNSFSFAFVCVIIINSFFYAFLKALLYLQQSSRTKLKYDSKIGNKREVVANTEIPRPTFNGKALLERFPFSFSKVRKHHIDHKLCMRYTDL